MIKIKKYSLISRIINRVSKFLGSIPNSPWWRRNYDRYVTARREYTARNFKKIKKYNQKWHKKNRDKVAQRKRQWCLDHKQEIEAYRKEWAKNNPDKIREYGKRSYAKRKANKADRYKNQSVIEVNHNENAN
jgi:hypothetical protein